MNIDQVDAICLSLNGARRQDLLGPGIRCWTVEGRIFATMADNSEQIALRCQDEKVAQLLVDHARAGMLPRLPQGCWVALDLSIGAYELHCRIIESYEMVRADGA
ncbi:MAG: hypothetical protein ACP5EN_10360 [Rhodovulum sp.]